MTRAVVGTVYYDREKLFTSRIQARFAATESRYNSNVPENDRSFFRWSVSLLLGGNLLK